MEGPITKEELTDQLLYHMKPNAVTWVRNFWNDLSNLCEAAVNNCYEKNELTRLLKTAIMRLLRKGRK